MPNIPELLSPAGDMEKLEAAVRFGADAVYLAGKQFGMRAFAGNFDERELAAAVEYAHARSVKVYVTCNTIPIDADLDELDSFIALCGQCGIDALIVSDVGVLSLAKRLAPNADIHISTQAGVTNSLTASEFYRMGAKRVILARELSLEDIKTIRAKTPPELELEAFVHGAMCVSFSGRCLLSQYLTGRDANRGECAQPCRWGYYLMEETRPGQFFKLEESGKGAFIMNAQDLCMIGHLDKLAASGVSSLKIEGRAKTAYYAAVITNAYRAALDILRDNPSDFHLPAWIAREPETISHRPYGTGFYFGQPEQTYDNGGPVRAYDIAAVVDDWQDGLLFCTQRNKLFRGDELEALEPGKPPVKIKAGELFDETGAPIDSTPHPMMRFSLKTPFPAGKGAILRKKAAAL